MKVHEHSSKSVINREAIELHTKRNLKLQIINPLRYVCVLYKEILDNILYSMLQKHLQQYEFLFQNTKAILESTSPLQIRQEMVPIYRRQIKARLTGEA